MGSAGRITPLMAHFQGGMGELGWGEGIQGMGGIWQEMVPVQL